MKRRQRFAATVAIAVMVTAGMGAYRGDRQVPREELCEVDGLSYLYETCTQDMRLGLCKGISTEFEVPCQVACVSHICPDEAACVDDDPVGCAPCDDMDGAAFWYTLEIAVWRCSARTIATRDEPFDPAAFMACYWAQVEHLCPALVDTDWDERVGSAFGGYPADRPSRPASPTRRALGAK
ncbi:hypothetical protein KEG38_01710 [Polyangium jinanense]|uniref:hypothetical protein n=1 Tax=Polyangium jinanense TaxID=2829994 RepID=UPI002340FC4C|nr:hypothetical protein [Polyangium jinanense]MDC3952536.1 hypothetical protein [Polyangium jinanense]